MMYYAELADHDGPTATAGSGSGGGGYNNQQRSNHNNNRSRRSSGVTATTSTISLDLDDLVGSSNDSLDSLCGGGGGGGGGSGGGNMMMMKGMMTRNGGFNRGIRRVSTTNNSSHQNSSFFDLGDDFDFNETDDEEEEDEDDDDDENDTTNNSTKDKIINKKNKKLHDQIQRLDDSKLCQKALSFASSSNQQNRMSMSENWAYDNHYHQCKYNNTTALNGLDDTRRKVVRFSNNEPEVFVIAKAQLEDYDCLYYDEMELQRMFDEFRNEEREARRHSLR